MFKVTFEGHGFALQTFSRKQAFKAARMAMKAGRAFLMLKRSGAVWREIACTNPA
jgi:hypothetical protein